MKLNRRGESLVELVVAIALFAIIVPSLYFALESSMRINLFSDTKSDLTYLVQAELENINALSPNGDVVTVLTNPPLNYTTDDNSYFSKIDADGIKFEVTHSIYTIPDSNPTSTIDSILLKATSKNETISLQLYVDFGAD